VLYSYQPTAEQYWWRSSTKGYRIIERNRTTRFGNPQRLYRAGSHLSIVPAITTIPSGTPKHPAHIYAVPLTPNQGYDDDGPWRCIGCDEADQSGINDARRVTGPRVDESRNICSEVDHHLYQATSTRRKENTTRLYILATDTSPCGHGYRAKWDVQVREQ
jgi:hypothetical protein